MHASVGADAVYGRGRSGRELLSPLIIGRSYAYWSLGLLMDGLIILMRLIWVR